MSDFCRRNLRTWGLLDGLYGLVLGALAVFVLPWKTPAANLFFLAYAATHLAVAPGLWRTSRWAWRVALWTSVLGLGVAVLAVTGLVAGWAYLRASYGAFGAGASLASLLLAGVVFQILGLYPAVRLRALLRREVRGAFRGGRAALVAAVALLPFPLVVGVAVHARYAVAPAPPWGAEAGGQALALLRQVVQGSPPAEWPATPALARLPVSSGPLAATLWREGRLVARVVLAEPAPVRDAIVAAGRALARRLDAASEPREGRLKLDRIVARTPLVRQNRLLFGLGIDPGLDGVGGRDGILAFLPDDVLHAGAAGARAPLDRLGELRLGVDVDWMEARIRASGLRGPAERWRSEGFVETERGPQPERRGNPTADVFEVRAAAVAGGDFILRQVEPDGRFRYQYDPMTDSRMGGRDYSLPRHAGTAYGLALLYATTGHPRFREGANGALAYLARQIDPGCVGQGAEALACVPENGQARLGPAALSAVAFLEYQRRTGDARYAGLAAGLLRFVSRLQKEDGDFHHQFDLGRAAVLPGPPRMFAAEQAALALVLGHALFGDAQHLGRARRALDYLTRDKYAFFLGRFIYGADHWTCIAADEAWPALKDRHYAEFCRGYARFMSRLQYRGSPEHARDFDGHFGFSYLLVPQAPATAGFTEALLSTVSLSRRFGLPVAELEAQSRAAVTALARDQVRAENAYLMRAPERAAGGIRRSLVEPEIRIDFVQHAASALGRAAAMGI